MSFAETVIIVGWFGAMITMIMHLVAVLIGLWGLADPFMLVPLACMAVEMAGVLTALS